MMLEFMLVTIMSKPTLGGQSTSWTARFLLKRADLQFQICVNQKIFSDIFKKSIDNLSHICYNIIVNKKYTFYER